MRSSLPFYQRAVELDPNFALAYQALAREQLNTDYSDLVAEAASKAYELRERTTENEEFRIVSFYHLSVTHDLNKAIEVSELWKQTYPNYWRPYHALADLYYTTGQYDKGVEAAREAVRLNPNVAAAYSNLAGSLLALNRFEEATDVYRQAMARNLDAPEYHYNLFGIAWFSGDAAAMRQQIDWFAGSSFAYGGLYMQSHAAATAGRWREALDLSGRAFEMVERRGMKGEVGGWAQMYALTGAALGDCKSSRRMALLAVASTTREMDLSSAAIALALCGEAGQARAISDRLAQRFPKDPTLNGVWLPTIRATIDLKRDLPNHGPDQAIDALKAVSLNEGTARFWPAYVRGLAYLRKRVGAEAAVSFQTILDHRGCTFWTPLYPLAHLGLARAAALTGDISKSRKAYQDFCLLWKDADPDIPVLQESKQEYNGLRFGNATDPNSIHRSFGHILCLFNRFGQRTLLAFVGYLGRQRAQLRDMTISGILEFAQGLWQQVVLTASIVPIVQFLFGLFENMFVILQQLQFGPLRQRPPRLFFFLLLSGVRVGKHKQAALGGFDENLDALVNLLKFAHQIGLLLGQVITFLRLRLSESKQDAR